MEIVGLTDTSNRSKAKIKKKKKKPYDGLTSSIDDLISPPSIDLSTTDFSTMKTHYRESSPVRRSSRSKVIAKSPIRRYRSSVRSRSPVFRSSRSPLSYPKSSIKRRSPRKIRSPKQSSPYRSSVRTISRKLPRLDSPPSTRLHTDRHGDVTRLLKKVKHLDSVGAHTLESNVSRSKEHQHSSLKEKIFNMLRKLPDDKNEAKVTQGKYLKEKSEIENDESMNDADDEEDLALLRQKALETKQNKSKGLSLDNPTDAKSEQRLIAKDDDQDVEALQLRMIALRSAVMKKHQNRVQRGIKANKAKPNRSESPFTQSFLDDIPVPGDELLKFASPPCTPPHASASNLVDSNHTEDMELDTDVEREKEKLPYSPTDRITLEIPVDTTLLGIDPSDVSFININETNSPIFEDERKRNEEMVLSTGASPYYNNTYLLHPYDAPRGSAYSPSQHSNDIFHSNLNNVQNQFTDYHSTHIECDLLDGICCQSNSTYSTETVPTHEETSSAAHTLPATSDIAAPCNLPDDDPLQIGRMIEKSQNSRVLFANMPSPFVRENKYSYETRTTSEYSGMGSEPFAESFSSSGSMMTIDDIANTEELTFDGDDKNLSVAHIPKQVTPPQAESEATLAANKEEPLYIQGIPDITDHLNKIPTLINRTLVPASILKSNKRLRQRILRLPNKHEVHPTFKSAEMQPVIVNTNTNTRKNDCTFKPIKLQPPKKPAPVLTAPVIFDDNPNENSENRDSSLSAKTEAACIDNAVADDNGCDDASTTCAKQKRKRIKKHRRKSSTQLSAEKGDNSRTKDGTNMSTATTVCTLEQQITESVRNKNDDENKMKEYFDNSRSSNARSESGSDTRSLSLSGNSNNVATENKDANKNDQNASLENKERTKQTALSNVKCLQEKSTKSYNPPINNVPNDPDSGTLDATNRRQSVDEDEDELRAILLASLAKRSKPDTNGNSAIQSVATNFIAIDIQATTQKTLASAPITVGTTSTTRSNAPTEATLNLSEIGGKKTVLTASVLNSSCRKRVTNGAATGVPKKMIKKAPIPASTKVVNNAKKYQNMIIQRKLNLRKLDNMCNKVKPSENVWSNVPKTLHASDTQRFVINLGSDTDSESETEKCTSVVSTVEKSQLDVNADFEKSVQKFLRDMRKEQEQSVAAVQTVSSSQARVLSPVAKRDAPAAAATQTDLNKGSSNMHTPLVRRYIKYNKFDCSFKLVIKFETTASTFVYFLLAGCETSSCVAARRISSFEATDFGAREVETAKKNSGQQ